MGDILWEPGAARVAGANITAFMHYVSAAEDTAFDNYAELYAFSIRSPERFWRAVWDFCEVRGKPGQRVLVEGERMPGARWFPQARLNFAENLLRRRDDRPAILFESETSLLRSLTYAELYREVAGIAAALKAAGIVPGDRVAGFLPNLPETIIAMLAATSIGAVWSSCSPDFGTQGVVDRLGQIEPRILFTTDSYAYNGKTHDCLERITEISHAIPSIERIVVAPYLGKAKTGNLEHAVTWGQFIEVAIEIDFERLPFDHPVYIMFSSGTTGVPKCIVHGAGGTLLQHLKELALHSDLKPEDRICYFTTCGWMMWNWLVSSLATGAAVVLYEGSPFYPGPQRMFDVIDAHEVSMFGTGAKMISAWEKTELQPAESHSLTSLRNILSTGSPLAPESFDYVYRDIKQDVCLSSISGGTDIISCFALGCSILPVRRGELQCIGLGMQVEIRRDDGAIAETGETGELCCGAPFPSMPVGFWNDLDGSKYRAAYFDQFPDTWAHGDFARITENGGMIIYGRSDATLNPGGVRIGTAEIYRQVEQLDEVLESICVGQDWDNDVRVVLFVRLREGVSLDDGLRERIRRKIRSNTTPRHVPARILQVTDIPRTVSGKIVELAVRNVIHGRPVKNIDALANPEALELYANLQELES
ncbi:MAG: acetoacetate--CoA ligase [Gammaproteobacteria bacterium]|nr:acetoacetate--CoA ligase [Gammaproteobacteria bacterium]